MDAWIQFVKAHPELACLFFFIWSFSETGLLLGLVLPAEKVLIVGGVLASKNVIPPESFFFCSTAGTILGYSASYLIGYFLGEEILKEKLSEFHRTSNFFKTKGEISIVFGRFLPVVRAVLPVVIGAFRPSFLVFTLYNACGAFIWIGSYLLFGNLMGRVFSFIIKHKLAGILLIPALLLFYVLWRRYGKNNKLF